MSSEFFMKWFLRGFIAVVAASHTAAALAAEWVNITTNSVGDKFLVDPSTIQRRGDAVWYWEYREFPQPNNAFLEEQVDEPVYGAVINWSVDCASKVQRLRRLTAYGKDRKVIRRFSYEDQGSLTQPQLGSSAYKVVDYVCKQDASDRSK
jgi:hypothetical protein